MTNYREILRLNEMGLSRTNIGAALGYSRNTVSEVLKRAENKGYHWPLAENLSNDVLQMELFPKKAETGVQKMPDYEKVHKELGKKGVTLTLLWDEYCRECRGNNEIPYAFTQFRVYYHRYANTTKATMHIQHKPGEKLEVDWSGTTANIVDRDTGEIIPAYIFVATLPCSGYTYVEAFLSQNLESFITAHIHAFQHFGGVARIVVPDNLKTGVTKADKYLPEINKTYNEPAEHYGCAVIPARVQKPKDKPSVEGAVGVIKTWIIAAIRNMKFFNIIDLNETIKVKLKEYNEKPFQKKPGSRLLAYLSSEKEYMLPLPKSHYELAIFKKITCGFNYHISFDTNFYSVPYEYIKCEMDVRASRNIVEIFYNNHRVCSHPRQFGHGKYHTIPEHMPEKHKTYTEWNGERFISWAKSIGEYTQTVIKAILSYHKIEQQGYRACMGVLKLGDKYGINRLEAACKKALSYTPSPSYKNIDSILKSASDKLITEEPSENPIDEKHSFIRGAEYYGGKGNV